MDQQVDIITTTPRTLAVVCFHCAASEIPDRIGDAFATVGAYLGRGGRPLRGPAVGYFRMRDDGFDVRAGFPASAPVVGDGRVATFDLPGAEVARAEHVGSYTTLPDTYDRMRSAVEGRGRHLDPTAPTWEEYWSAPGEPPETTRTVVYWPLLPASPMAPATGDRSLA